ncbi:origin of replication complex subunit 3 [Canna indica]|uniref:Origin of replication complex subunit 3 n=1 Tax=Canna indica TaxID=4628 RepID=A0AAQ3QK53_9LILI|nr:origin of replication complex subunit 3 [Canna indica]
MLPSPFLSADSLAFKKMPPFPACAPPSSPTIDDDADKDLQPFFVLHKSVPQKCEQKALGSSRTRRKIDLPPSSPRSSKKLDAVAASDSPSDAVYERLRLDAFNLVWSKIDATIKEVLRGINLNLFDEVHKWILESFSAIKSCNPRSALEIRSPYPLINDVICKQIPTAMMLTKNAEFVDDLLTFQELGEHLKSMGCHVANLSALDFCAKNGVAGCLRSLLRQFVVDAPDVADLSVLSSWYCEPDNYDHPLIIVIDDMERYNGAVLADFILMLSEWAIKLPIIFIIGVATTDTARRLLPSDALQHLQPCKFTLGSPFERMNALVEAVLVKQWHVFNIGHRVAVFLRNYFFVHDGTVTSFVRALKLACVKHFSMEPMSFLGIDMLDENYEVSLHGKCGAMPDSLLKYVFDLPSCKREKDSRSNSGDLAKGLSELRRVLKAWSSVVMCLYEVGKHNKVQLLDIFCEATDPSPSSLKPSSHKLENFPLNGQNLIEGKLCLKRGVISQLIHTVRELSVASLSKLLNSWSIHTEEINEIHGKVRELQLVIKSATDEKNFQEKHIDYLKSRMKTSLSVGKASFSVNEKAASLLEDMLRNFLIPIECRRFHEIVCFRNVGILQAALIGDPRREIQINLLKSKAYIKCTCCSCYESILSPTMHDTSIMYHLAQEYGDLINLQDWYHSFKETVLSASNKVSRQLQRSPMSKKVKPAVSEPEASIQLFITLSSAAPMAVSGALVSSHLPMDQSLIALVHSQRFLYLESSSRLSPSWGFIRLSTLRTPRIGAPRCMVRQGGASSYSTTKVANNMPLRAGFWDSIKSGTEPQNFNQAPRQAMVVRSNHPQNTDLPRYYSKKEKKPFPVPIVELRRRARERLKSARGKPRKPTAPPRNGMLVQSLIPVAYEVMNARILLINNLRKLMKVVPVLACKYCNEIHVGSIGHSFKTCRGLQASRRKGLHDWMTATVEDVFVPIESYHLFDRLGKRISHDERFAIPRIPAVVELCIQAGVDLVDLPTKRRRKPVIRIGRSEIIDADEDDLPDPKPCKFKKPILDEVPESEIVPPANAEEIALLSEETLQAWETLRNGAAKLMRKYPVRVCGYCPEVHVGASGHKAQNCGAHKHQQRNGQHGWQAAVLNDLIPPRYVWHVPETVQELQWELRNFYGQAPAIVEICVKGGAAVPDSYKPTMRLDIGIPSNLREAEMVV